MRRLHDRVTTLLGAVMLLGCDTASEQAAPPTAAGSGIEQLQASLMVAGSPSASDAQRDDAITELRKQPRLAAAELRRAYAASPREHYMRRWSMIETMGELDASEALETLAEVALTPTTAVGEDAQDERMIQFRAIDGLARLSSRGVLQADEVLKRCMKSSDLATRRAAAHAFVGYKRTKQRLAEVKAVLSPGEHHLMDMRRDPSEPQLPAYE